MSAITRAPRVSARLEPFRWEWAEREAEAIRANWERRKRDTPAIFDGRVLLVHALSERDGEVEVAFFEASYSALIAHTDAGWPDRTVQNGFAMGALRSRDGAFLLGEMAAHTAQAGRLYFPAGTPDRSDVRPDGAVDLAGSVVRELAEETGLGPDVFRLGESWTIVAHDGRLAFMLAVDLVLDADEALARIAEHWAGEAQPELARMHVLRGPDAALEARMPSFLPVFLRDAWGAPRS